MSDSVTRHFVRIAEGDVHYRSVDEVGSGRTLVALHPSPASSKSLAPLLGALAPGGHVIAPDTMGNGQSCALQDDAPEIADYADAMERMADALGLDQVDVYGSHTGAHIAIEWAIAQPGRVRSVILDGIAYLPGDLREEYLANYAPRIVPDQIGSQFNQAWHFIRDQMFFFPHYHKDADHLRVGGTFDADVLHGLTMDVLGSLDTYHLAYEAVFKHDLAKRLPLVGQKVLLVVPNDDYLAEGTKFALENLPDAATAKVEGDFDMAARAEVINPFLGRTI